MKSQTFDSADLLESIESLRAEIRRLNQRISALEKRPTDGQPKPAPAMEAPKTPPIPEDVILAISAAIAAYLGVKPHIRQIRLVASPPWVNQGRITIQASHILARHQA
jgi:methylmalonyl-CoA carboxyltransferase 12S subunit